MQPNSTDTSVKFLLCLAALTFLGRSAAPLSPRLVSALQAANYLRDRVVQPLHCLILIIFVFSFASICTLFEHPDRRCDMPDGMSLDEEVRGEEVSNDEENHEYASVEETSSELDRATCAVCGVGVVAAQSRFHRPWGMPDHFGKAPAPLHAFEAGSKDCLVCELILSAVLTWAPATSSGVQDVLVSSMIWYGFGGGREMDVRIFRPKTSSGSFGKQIILDVFRMQGMWNLMTCFSTFDHNSHELLTFAIAGIDSAWHIRELTEASGDTSSPQAVSTIKRWMRECQESHPDCERSGHLRSKPDRLLELTKNKVTLRRGKELPDDYQYACLSHCWGSKGPSYRLTSETSDELLSGKPIMLLPQTFQDAIKLCLHLGLQYLWIDALCK